MSFSPRHRQADCAISNPPWLRPDHIDKLKLFGYLLTEKNSFINLISKKDVENVYLKHILHSVLISEVVRFSTGMRVMDAGTGGGFPGVPLAIVFPEVEFHLVDSIGKKMTALTEMVSALQLDNVRIYNERVERMSHRYDFVVSRAVTNPNVLCQWIRHTIKPVSRQSVANGLLYLRGNEPLYMPIPHRTYALKHFCAHPFFETKQLLHVPLPPL